MLCISGNSDFIISDVTITIKYKRSVFSNHSSLGDLSISPHIHLYTSKITVLPTTVFLICLRECQTETGATMKTMDRSISVRAVGKPGKRWEDAVREDSVKLLVMKAWETKAKDRQFWRQHIEEAKA
jgi:hypothetical protein